jgi:hypothetical protein
VAYKEVFATFVSMDEPVVAFLTIEALDRSLSF